MKCQPKRSNSHLSENHFNSATKELQLLRLSRQMLITALLLTLPALFPATAQDDTTVTLSGTVYGPDEISEITDATVYVMETGKQHEDIQWFTRTDSDGRYELVLNPGTYNLGVSRNRQYYFGDREFPDSFGMSAVVEDLAIHFDMVRDIVVPFVTVQGRTLAERDNVQR